MQKLKAEGLRHKKLQLERTVKGLGCKYRKAGIIKAILHGFKLKTKQIKRHKDQNAKMK